MTSTNDLSELPDVPGLKRLTQSLALLDAIISPDWHCRYYSFNAAWGDGESMASMRNGEGDGWFALFTCAGCVLHGLAHEAPIYRPGDPPRRLFADLPSVFHRNFLHEPAFDTSNSTFCIWRLAQDDHWSCNPPLCSSEDADGSRALLAILAGRPEQYVRFAEGYYERTIAVADVALIYSHSALDERLALRLNPEVALADIADDLQLIGYPTVR